MKILRRYQSGVNTMRMNGIIQGENLTNERIRPRDEPWGGPSFNGWVKKEQSQNETEEGAV